MSKQAFYANEGDLYESEAEERLNDRKEKADFWRLVFPLLFSFELEPRNVNVDPWTPSDSNTKNRFGGVEGYILQLRREDMETESVEGRWERVIWKSGESWFVDG